MMTEATNPQETPLQGCTHHSLIDQHFAGRISRTSERKLRQHLPACPACERYYERHLVLAELDPKSAGRQSRLARGLGLESRRPLFARPTLLALAGAAAALLLVVAIWPRGTVAPGGFTPRGGAVTDDGVELQLFKVSKGRKATPVEGVIGANDELAVAYRNRADGARKHLLVFGVDEQKRIHWYHPAWQDPASNPTAVPISSEPGLHELPEAVSHELKGAKLTIYGVFTDERLSVRQVEALVNQGARGEKLPISASSQVVIPLDVRSQGD